MYIKKEFEDLVTVITDKGSVEANGLENLRNTSDEFVQLNRYEEEVTEDRWMSGCRIKVLWKLNVEITGSEDSGTTISMKPEILRVKGEIKYEDYINQYGDSSDLMAEVGIDSDDIEQEYSSEFDTNDDEEWEIAVDGWDKVRIDNIEPTYLNIDFNKKKIEVSFEYY